MIHICEKHQQGAQFSYTLFHLIYPRHVTNCRGSSVVKVLCYKFFIHIKSFRSHCGPGVDSASNRNKYQAYFLGVKAAGA